MKVLFPLKKLRIPCTEALTAILQGMALIGSIYNQPPISPVRYKRPLDANMKAIGGDFRKAIKTFNKEQNASSEKIEQWERNRNLPSEPKENPAPGF